MSEVQQCIECGKPADRKFGWPTSGEYMEALFCAACAEAWWSKFKHTPSGQGLRIQSLDKVENNVRS